LHTPPCRPASRRSPPGSSHIGSLAATSGYERDFFREFRAPAVCGAVAPKFLLCGTVDRQGRMHGSFLEIPVSLRIVFSTTRFGRTRLYPPAISAKRDRSLLNKTRHEHAASRRRSGATRDRNPMVSCRRERGVRAKASHVGVEAQTWPGPRDGRAEHPRQSARN
jgi:hypothetical protein